MHGKSRPIGAAFFAFLCAALGAAPTARSAEDSVETIEVGTIGAPSAVIWPFLIGNAKGIFAAEGLAVDLVFIPSSPAVQQQLSAGSLPIADGGLIDPVRAIFQGAPIALVRIEGQAPPYALLGQPAIKSIADLRGKTIVVGGANDITHLYLVRMMGPSGLKPTDYDLIYAGATISRYSALQAGVVSAAILYPPFNFHAEAAGFTNLGLVVDYAKDLPFSAISVNRAWAARNGATVAKLLAAYTKAVAWFDDDRNRGDAIEILMTASKQARDDIEKSYDLYRKIDFFERNGNVSKKKIAAVIDVVKGDFGDKPLDIDTLFLPGVTRVVE